MDLIRQMTHIDQESPRIPMYLNKNRNLADQEDLQIHMNLCRLKTLEEKTGLKMNINLSRQMIHTAQESPRIHMDLKSLRNHTDQAGLKILMNLSKIKTNMAQASRNSYNLMIILVFSVMYLVIIKSQLLGSHLEEELILTEHPKIEIHMKNYLPPMTHIDLMRPRIHMDQDLLISALMNVQNQYKGTHTTKNHQIMHLRTPSKLVPLHQIVTLNKSLFR